MVVFVYHILIEPIIGPFQVAITLGDLNVVANQPVWFYRNLSHGRCILKE